MRRPWHVGESLILTGVYESMRRANPCHVRVPAILSCLTLVRERHTMIGSNILLTLVVGSGLGLLIWKQPPPVWTAMPILGLCLVLVGFVLWTTARFQLGKSLTVTAQAKQLVRSEE